MYSMICHRPFRRVADPRQETVLTLDMRKALTRAENAVFGFVECDMEVPQNTTHALDASRTFGLTFSTKCVRCFSMQTLASTTWDP